MSFGFSVSDFLAVGKLCWKTYKTCKESTGAYAELSSEVSGLYTVIKETEELLDQQGLTEAQQAKLLTCQSSCEKLLEDLNALLSKYQSLGTKSQRTFDRLAFGNQDLNGIRQRVILNVSMLDAFNNASSHARLEKKLNLLISEVRAGKREGSIISEQDFGTKAQRDQETWNNLRRELEDIGISPATIFEKRVFIIRWFQEAVAAGRLDQDMSSGEDGSSMDEGRSASILERHNSSTPISVNKAEQALVPSTGASDPKPGNVIHEEVGATAHDLPEPPQEEKWSRLRVPDLSSKLMGKDSALFSAISLGDESLLRDHLLKGVNPNTVEDGRTALHYAVGLRNKDIVALLLNHNADPNKLDEDGRTALHFAVGLRNKDMITLLLKHNADPNKLDKSGGTALHFAVGLRNKDIVPLLLNHNADPTMLDKDGRTALHFAVGLGNKDMITLLLKHNADPNKLDKYGGTALGCAVLLGKKDMVTLILKQNVDLDTLDKDGRTPLHLAVFLKNTDTATLLLKQNADPNTLDKDGDTVLHYATREGHTDFIALLLKSNADVNARGWQGHTPLMKACSHRKRGSERHCEEIVVLLLDHGADTEILNDDGKSAIMLAVEHGRSITVDALLRRGANADPASKHTKHTALYFAATNGEELIMRLLVKNGADVNRLLSVDIFAVDLSSRNPSSHQMMKLLIELGGDLNRLGRRDGKTMLMRVTKRLDAGAVDSLIRLGADVKIESRSGETALVLLMQGLRFAIEDRHLYKPFKATMKLLLDAGASLDETDQHDHIEGRALSVDQYKRYDSVIKLMNDHKERWNDMYETSWYNSTPVADAHERFI